jgi:hypothetical protein
MEQYTRRAMLATALGAAGAAAVGAAPQVGGGAHARKPDKLTDQILKEMGRIHGAQKKGLRLEHIRGMAGQVRLLAVVTETNGTDDVIKNGVRGKHLKHISPLTHLRTMHDELLAFGVDTDGAPVPRESTAEELAEVERIMSVEGVSKQFVRIADAMDQLAVNAERRGLPISLYDVGREARIRRVQAGAGPLKPEYNPECIYAERQAGISAALAASICLFGPTPPCIGATIAAIGLQTYALYVCW